MLLGVKYLIITLCLEGGWECMWGRVYETTDLGLEESMWLFVMVVTLRGRLLYIQQLLVHIAVTM